MGQDNRYLKPGDLIEIDREIYHHWALYVGHEYVIHVTSEGSKNAFMSVSTGSNITGKAKVKKELLKKVVGNNKWRVNNKYDRSRTPFPVNEVIRRAEEWIDREVPYRLITNNCEHFVTMLRYGEGVSGQVKKPFDGLLERLEDILSDVTAFVGKVLSGVTS